jgi:hypothetical protein
MPRYGFELCSHRRLEGLDEAMKMVGAEKAWPTAAGHCGDRPGRIVEAALQRADAVERWPKSAKTWIQRIATTKPYDAIPEHPKDLPELPAAR